jgi:hypothetical protein
MTDRQERIRYLLARSKGIAELKVEYVTAPNLFPTPKNIAEMVIEYADIRRGMRVLEPSAGTGALLDAIPNGCDVTAWEINSGLYGRLLSKYPDISVGIGDFLKLFEPGWDRIVMNPPFDHGLDINHILHAQELLAPQGRLVAICADGPRQREEFSEAKLYEPLPNGTFKYQGTMVNTAIVIINERSKK